jgi:hypothetical protein
VHQQLVHASRKLWIDNSSCLWRVSHCTGGLHVSHGQISAAHRQFQAARSGEWQRPDQRLSSSLSANKCSMISGHLLCRVVCGAAQWRHPILLV